MSVNIKQIYTCPQCGESITSTKRPDHCPKCNYSFGEEGVEYKLPLTMNEQRSKFQDDRDFYEAILTMPLEKANNIMNDALNIAELLPAKNSSQTDIRNLVEMAIKLGSIAQRYKDFLAAGGIHVPTLFLNDSSPGVLSDNTKKKGARSDAS
jgi:hypothetical protein